MSTRYCVLLPCVVFSILLCYTHRFSSSGMQMCEWPTFLHPHKVEAGFPFVFLSAVPYLSLSLLRLFFRILLSFLSFPFLPFFAVTPDFEFLSFCSSSPPPSSHHITNPHIHIHSHPLTSTHISTLISTLIYTKCLLWLQKKERASTALYPCNRSTISLHATISHLSHLDPNSAGTL